MNQTLRDGYMNGISNTDMVSAAKAQQAGKVKEAARAGYTKGTEDNNLTSQLAYEQGVADSLAELEFRKHEAQKTAEVNEILKYKNMDPLMQKVEDNQFMYGQANAPEHESHSLAKMYGGK
jgi:hypothetical protein